MCGLVGVVAASGTRLSIDERVLTRMRDRLVHRGPDDAGLFMGEGVGLGHRRLAVIDPTPAGRQPMSTPDGRWTIVYNGELYNDADVRQTLSSEGLRPRSDCDTETVLLAIGRWGVEARRRLRGMYAFGAWDAERRRLVLARDPLGIKPLHFTVLNGREIVFASEVRAILDHPAVGAVPDMATASGYLTNVRTTLDDRTLFEGVRTLRPGEWIEIDASGDELAMTRSSWWDDDHASVEGDTRDVVREAVFAHLRSDVPLCSLLSGGLDSSAIARVASERATDLRTYCSGAVTEERSDDFSYAREAAEWIGSVHTEVIVSREDFIEKWAGLVDHLCTPLSTPNEVAILAVAQKLRGEGNVVALSGEGADELFAGYSLSLAGAERWIETTPDEADGGGFELQAAAWVPIAMKPSLLTDDAIVAAGGDAELRSWYAEVYRDGVRSGLTRLDAHRHVHQRINLEGLLRRLDTSTMAASVEGRTPLADQVVALHAAGLPMERKFIAYPGGASHTKIALREAFANDLPPSIVRRPKASFPLPFQAWVGDAVETLRDSSFVNAVFRPEAIEQLTRDPGGLWNIAWPALNLAMWGRRWWG